MNRRHDEPVFRGSCLCGGVRYQVQGAPARSEHCHCAMCRKAHGAAFSTNVVVETGRLTVVEGESLLSQYASSPNRRKCFCSRCGSQLFIRRLDRPEVTVITLATLDDDPAVLAERHVFVGSKATWTTIGDALPQYVVYPGFEPEEEPVRR